MQSHRPVVFAEALELVRASLNLNITTAYKQTHVIGVDDREHIFRTDACMRRLQEPRKKYTYTGVCK